MSKKSIEQEVNEFLQLWDCKQMHDFLRDIGPVLELYDVTETQDWVSDAVGAEDTQIVRLTRTAYLISRLAELHSGRLASVKMKFKDLYLRMEQSKVLNDN